MDDFVLSAFSGSECEYHFVWENLRFALYLDSGLFQSEDAAQYVNLQLHDHDHYEWFFVTNGQMRLVAQDREYILKKNDFAIVRPNQPHYVEFLQKNTTRYNFRFAFEPAPVCGTQDLYKELCGLLGDLPVVSGAGSRELADVNRRISQLCGTNRRAMICAGFAELIAALQESLGAQPTAAPIEALLADDTLSRTEKLRRIFDGYYMYDLSMAQVAEGFGVSTRQLNRIVRQVYDCTFHERLSYMRICSARQMLLRTDYTVGEIARWVGYTSLCGFYNAFKNQYGCLPTDCRKKGG